MKKFSPFAWAAAAVIALFLAINFLNIHKYGESLDEERGQIRGRLSWQLVSEVFLGGPSVPERRMEYFKTLRHPTFFAMLNAPVTQWAQKQGWDCVAAKHVFLIFWSGVGLVFLYLLTARALGSAIGFLAVLCLSLYPLFIAHAQTNPKDVPLMVFALMALYVFQLFLDKKNIYLAVLSGVLLGFTAATGFNGFLLLPIMAVAIWFEKDWQLYRPLSLAGAWMAAAVGAFYAGWPLLWREPDQVIKSLRHFSSEFIRFRLSYLGTDYTPATLPWHYTPMNLFAATPVLIVLLALVGVWALRRRTGNIRQDRLRILLLPWFAIPLLSQMIPGTARYDGMRHVFLCVPPLIICAAVGFQAAGAWIQRRMMLSSAKIFGTMGVLLVSSLTWQIVQVHPLEGLYLNEAVRLVVRKDLDRYFSLTTWAAPYQLAVEWLNREALPGARVCIAHGYAVDCILRKDIVVDCKNQPDYEVVLINHRHRLEANKEHPRVFTVDIYDTPALTIFQKARPRK